MGYTFVDTLLILKSLACHLKEAAQEFTCPHQPLLYKLSSLNVNPFLLRWIHNYLSNRSQSVILGGVQSKPLAVVSGVPQGSVLGPLLFLVYIDSVASTVNHSKIIIYTDDITLYKIIRNPSDFTFLQEDVISICIWIADNYLTLNSQKSGYMLFSRRAHPTLPAQICLSRIISYSVEYHISNILD